MNKVDTKKLLTIPKTSKEAKAICEFLAERARASRVTNLAGFRHSLKVDFGHDIKDREAHDRTWSMFEEAGIGKIVLSPRGVPQFFDWKGYVSKTVGEAALDANKHPEMAKFRNRPLKKHHPVTSQPARGNKSEPHAGEPKRRGNTAATYVKGEDGIHADKVFSVFMTNDTLSIKAELSQGGLSVKDREKLLEMVRGLPVRD